MKEGAWLFWKRGFVFSIISGIAGFIISILFGTVDVAHISTAVGIALWGSIIALLVIMPVFHGWLMTTIVGDWIKK